MSPLPCAGLSSVEAADRLKSHGYNELPAAERRGVFRIAFEVVRQPMFALLIAGGMNWPIGESGCSRSPNRRRST